MSAPVECREFVAIVAEMRARQREFFALRPDQRPSELLRDCKRLERLVDDRVTEYRVRQGGFLDGRD
jgi:hypothetical protein